MAKKRRGKSKKKGKNANYSISFADGKVVKVYADFPRQAVAKALKKHRGKVKSVKYVG